MLVNCMCGYPNLYLNKQISNIWVAIFYLNHQVITMIVNYKLHFSVFLFLVVLVVAVNSMFCIGGTVLHINTVNVNSSPPSAAYMRQWMRSALVQIMTCRLFGAKPLSKPMQGSCQLDLRIKLQWNFNQNTKLFIHKNAFENIVCQMAAISFRGGAERTQSV